MHKIMIGKVNSSPPSFLSADALFSCSLSPLQAAEELIKLSASILLKKQIGEGEVKNALFVILEDFAIRSPAERAVLERSLPYSVIHTARMDLARGPGSRHASSMSAAAAAAEEDGS